MQNDLSTLVREAQGGSSHAFAQLYSMYARDLYRFALYLTGKQPDAEDCVQEAVLIAFRKLTALSKPSSFKSWIFSILFNVCRARLSVSADRLYPIPIHEIQEIETISTGEDTGLTAEINEALGALEPDERQIVLLSVIGRYKSGEISEMLCIPAGTVRSKLSRSLTKLRIILQ